MSKALAPTPTATPAWRWPLERRDGVVLVAWFAVLTALWAGVGLLLTGPLGDSAVVRADEDLSQWLADHRTPWLDDVTWVGSMLADTVVKIVVTAVVAVVMLAVWRSWREPVAVVLALVLEATTFVVVTAIVRRPRPDVVRLEGSPIDSSFPSGHTAAAAAYGAIVVVVWWRTDRRWIRVASAVAVVLVVVFVGASRAYRGMHHGLDVVAGAALGAVAVAVVARLLSRRPTEELAAR
ncbi:MAG: phosphatase PAP2 family protein [Ilumatobacteraceae bacterium]